MKLYTEEQVKRCCEISFLCGLKGNHPSYQYLIENLPPIKLPGDKEIEDVTDDFTLQYGIGFKRGAEWVIELIKEQSDGKD